MQQFPITVGEDLNNITACYVAVDSILYSLPTVTKCADIAFKPIIALNTEYPKGAEPIWLLLQKVVYKIHTAYNNYYQSVESLIAEAETDV